MPVVIPEVLLHSAVLDSRGLTGSKGGIESWSPGQGLSGINGINGTWVRLYYKYMTIHIPLVPPFTGCL